MIEKTGMLPINPATVAPLSAPPNGTGAAELGKKFGAFLNEAIHQVEGQQKQVDVLSEQFASGQLADVHQLMIASEKASLSLELTVQIRNKVIEAYQEIMRMQI